MFITVLVGLYLTRVVLNQLGVEDYGIYNLIGGVIALLSFLQSALNVSTQRFLSVTMGKNDLKAVVNVFSSSLAIHISLSIGILIILELCAPFLFNGYLNIPADRIEAAKLVYHIMIFSTFISVLQVPFSAEMTANEDLWVFAIIESFGAIVKLGIVFIFDWYSFDELVIYSLWMLLATIISFIPKLIWCLLKYRECRIISFWNYVSKKSIKEMIGFTGWNAFGTLALVGRNQGVAILLNIFWGPAINAVYGIANQVNSQLVYFSQVMTTSVTPQIMKSEGEGNRQRMLRLSVFASKMAYFLSSVFALPLIVEIRTVLSFWLKEVPEYTEIYCILILCMFLVMQLYPGLTRAVQATGKIRQYQVVTSILLLLPIPLGYLMYNMGMHNTSILYLMILSQVAQMLYVLIYTRKRLGLDIVRFSWFITKAVMLFSLVLFVGRYLHQVLSVIESSLISFLIVCSVIVILFSAITYFFVFDKQERLTLNNLLNSLVMIR